LTAAIGIGAIAFTTAASAADPGGTPPAPGKPIVLFSPDTSAHLARPHRHPVASARAKHSVAPVERIPLDAQSVIPPSTAGPPLGPPPEPRPALSLETDLQPLTAPAPPSLPPAGTVAPAAKSPSG